MSAGLQRTFSSLSVPNYRRYFTGQVISISGNWMQIVAEMWLIVQLTGSGVSVGVTAALQFLPMLLFGAWGGLLADRVPKLRLLKYTQALMAVPALTLWALTATGDIAPWMVFGLVLARGSVLAIDNPARQAFVMELVGPERIVNAVSLNSVVVHCSRIAGPAAAGAVIAIFGVSLCFAINALSFIAMLVALSRMDRSALMTSVAGPAGAGRRAARAAPRPRDPGAVDPARRDGAGGHAVVQLPGPDAAARPLDVARHRDHLRGDDDGDGHRLRRPARC